MSEKSGYLDKLAGRMEFIAGIPEEELCKLKELAKPVSIKKNGYYLMAGEVPDRIGFVISGLLRLFYIDKSGTEINKHFCFENTLAISYSAFLLREQSNLYIQALEDSVLYTVDYATYDRLLKSHICWERAARKLAELLFILKSRREVELLINSASERYLAFLKDYPKLDKRLTQYHIASYLGITPESLSRILSNLK